MMKAICALVLVTLTISKALPEDCKDWGVTKTPYCQKLAKQREIQQFYRDLKPEKWQEAFDLAFKKNQGGHVRYLLDWQKTNADKVSFKLDGKLHDAAAKDLDQIIPVLIEQGMDVNAQDGEGNTPLHRASNYGAAKVVSFLLKNNHVDPNIQNKKGIPAVGNAISTGNISVLAEYLPHARRLDFNFKIDDKQLIDIIIEHDSIAALKLVYPKIDKNKLPTSSDGMPLAHAAATYNAPKITRYLLNEVKVAPLVSTVEQGEKDQKYVTFAVDLAAINGYTDVLDAYIERDPSLLKRVDPISGETYLLKAIRSQRMDLAEYLVKKGASLNTADARGQTSIELVRAVKKQLAERPERNEAENKTLERYVAFEKELVKRNAKNGGEIFAKALAQSNAKALVDMTRAMPMEELFGLITELARTRKASLIRAILKENKHTKEAPLAVDETRMNDRNLLYSKMSALLINDPALLEEKNWPVLDALINSSPMTKDLVSNCTISTYCLFSNLLEAEPKVLEKLVNSRPDLTLSSIHGFYGGSLGMYVTPLDYLKFAIDGGVPSSFAGYSEGVDLPGVYSRFNQERRKKRLVANRVFLIKKGAKTSEELKAIFKEYKELAKNHSGKDILKKYSPKFLISIQNIEDGMDFLDYAIAYRDEAVVDALVSAKPASSQSQTYNSERKSLLAVGSIREKLVKANYIKETPESCAFMGAFTFFRENPEALIDWVKQAGMKNCADDGMSIFESLFLDMYSPHPKNLALWEAFAKDPIAMSRMNKDDRFFAALANSCGSDSRRVIELLLQNGLDVNRSFSTWKGKSGTFLREWVENSSDCKGSDHLDQLKLLLANGANIKADKDISPSLIHMFINSGMRGFDRDEAKILKVVEMLAAAGDDIKALNSIRKTVPEAFIDAFAPNAISKSFLEKIVELGVDPIVQRECLGYDTFAFRGYDHLNQMHEERKAKKLREESKESCENVKVRVRAEYLSDLTVYNRFIQRMKKAVLARHYEISQLHYTNAFELVQAPPSAKNVSFMETLCCDATKVGCEEFFRCTNIRPEGIREEAELLCRTLTNYKGRGDLFMNYYEDGKTIGELKRTMPLPADWLKRFKDDKSFVTLTFSFEHKRRSQDQARYLESSVYLVLDPVKGFTPEQQFDAQIPNLMRAAGFSSLEDYAQRRYPQCKDIVPSKVTEKTVKPGAKSNAPKATPAPNAKKTR